MKQLAKRLAFAMATVLIMPLLLAYRLRSRGGREADGAFQAGSQLLALAPTRVGVFLRAAYYAALCTDVDREVTIGFMTLFSHADTVLGKHVYVGAQCNIGSCSIGSGCLLGSGVHVLSGKHQHAFEDVSRPIRNQGGRYERIRIGEDCWIGNQATLLADVGARSVVAAGAVVIDAVPARCIVGGNPARILRRLDD